MISKLLKISTLTLFFLVLIFIVPTMAQNGKDASKKDKTQKEQKVQKEEHDELITIVGRFFDNKLSSVNISINGKEYKKQKYEVNKTDENYNFNPLILIVEDYTNKGWKLVDSNMTSSVLNGVEVTYSYFILKRKVKSE